MPDFLGITMDIAGEIEEISLAVYESGFVSVLKQGAEAMVAFVEIDDVAGS